jgi:SAM-dependent methyltransferase
MLAIEDTRVDVFGAALEARAFLIDFAIAAGHELGVFEALARGGPGPLDAVASRIGVAARHRLRALLDVLAAIGAIRCARGGREPRFAAPDTAPVRPVVARDGWGRLAEVIRCDRPLPVEPGGEALRRLHHHLASAGAAAAGELAAGLDAGSLLDLGAGAGAYSKAFLEANPAGRATLVDRDEVLALAVEWLGPLAARAHWIAGDAAEVELGSGYDAALLANLLHLHPPGMCGRLVAAAAGAVAPGGTVAIKDLRVDDDRAGPIEGLLFALTMAIYTDAGDAYSTAQLRAWLTEAGLVDLAEHRLAAAPDAIVVIGRRPSDPAKSGTCGGTAAR